MTRLLIIALLLLAQVGIAREKHVAVQVAGMPNGTERGEEQPMKPNPEWMAQKFSMFIHWGLYSELGGVWQGKPVGDGYSEQIQSFAKIPAANYEAVARRFTADRWNADSVVALARAAGARSIVFTSKHHDGFCMYDSKYTDYDVVDATPAGRDVMRELADACARQGVCFAVYYSLIDWHFPGNGITPHNADPITPEHHAYSMKQVEEILTNYGPVSEIWFDMGSLTAEQSKELYDLVTRLQPGCMVSGRLGNDRGDFAVMADNAVPDYKIGVPWQTPASFFPETWSYRSWQERGDVEDKVSEKLWTLVEVVSRGGNFLLNIGPQGDGSVVSFEAEVLRRMGQWLGRYGEGIYGCEASPLEETMPWGGLTRKDDTLYLFVNEMPGNGKLLLKGLVGEITDARLLADDRPLNADMTDEGLTLCLPADAEPDGGIIVVRVILAKGWRALPREVVRGTVLDAANAVPVYAYSSMDYYSTFRSTVGRTWHFAWDGQHVQPCIEYTAGDRGKVIYLEIDGQRREVTLEGGTARPLSSDAGTVEWGETQAYGPFESRFPVGEEAITTQKATPWDALSRGETKTMSMGDRQALVVETALESAREQEVLVEVGVADALEVSLNDTVLLRRTYVGGVERRPEVVKLPLRQGENCLRVTLYNRYGCEVTYRLNTALPQELYVLPLERFSLREGKVHDCAFGLAHPANKNSDMGMPDICVILE